MTGDGASAEGGGVGGGAPASRVLHVSSSLDPTTGGPANVLRRLASLQGRRGMDVTVVTGDEASRIGDEIGELGAVGVSVFACGPTRTPISYSPRTLPAIARWCDSGGGVAHIHGLWQHAPHWGAGLLRRRGVPYIFRPCGMLDPWSLAQSPVRKRAMLALRGRRDLNGAAGLHFTTETERELARPLGLRPPGFVVPNGVDWSEFEILPEWGALRRRLGIGEEPLVVFLSRLHYKKGLDLLLPAFAEATAAPTQLALIGPGEGSYVRSLERQAEELGISSRVHFPGMLGGERRVEALVDADLFCLPSYQENFGVVVVEALAAGTAALISDQVNIHAEVSGAGAGVAVACDRVALGEAMASMLADRSGLARQGEAGRAMVAERFTWDRIADRVGEMYAAAAGGRAAAGPGSSGGDR